MQNAKEIFIEAINDYDLFSNQQKAVLNTLVSVSVDNVAYISALTISKAIKLAANSVYIILRGLEESGYITRQRDKHQKSNSYLLNSDKIDILVKIYKEKKSGLSKVS